MNIPMLKPAENRNTPSATTRTAFELLFISLPKSLFSTNNPHQNQGCIYASQEKSRNAH